ncbi:hypothetical protein LTR08_005702 [Meristemomyces frigidus]|nr:hypothetical protein LTR08_005702 [Meristemomyces frigidus]
MSGRYRGASQAGAEPFTLDNPAPVLATDVVGLQHEDALEAERDNSSDISSSSSDGMYVEWSFLDRALQWQDGEFDEIEELVADIRDAFENHAFDVDQDQLVMRTACERLLSRRLPSFHRAQLLVFIACSEDKEDGSENVEIIRQHVEDAEYWINEVEDAMLAAGLFDSRLRVESLKDTITKMSRSVDEAESESESGTSLSPSPIAETLNSNMPRLPSGLPGWKPSSQPTRANIDRKVTAAKLFERDVADMQAQQAKGKGKWKEKEKGKEVEKEEGKGEEENEKGKGEAKKKKGDASLTVPTGPSTAAESELVLRPFPPRASSRRQEPVGTDAADMPPIIPLVPDQRKKVKAVTFTQGHEDPKEIAPLRPKSRAGAGTPPPLRPKSSMTLRVGASTPPPLLAPQRVDKPLPSLPPAQPPFPTTPAQLIARKRAVSGTPSFAMPTAASSARSDVGSKVKRMKSTSSLFSRFKEGMKEGIVRRQVPRDEDGRPMPKNDDAME